MVLLAVIKKIKARGKNIPIEVRKSYEQVIDSINKLIDEMSVLREEVFERMENFGQSESEIKFLNLVENRDFSQIKGALVS